MTQIPLPLPAHAPLDRSKAERLPVTAGSLFSKDAAILEAAIFEFQ